MASLICHLLDNHTDFISQTHSLMKSFGSTRKNFHLPSPKSQFPENKPPPIARRPVLNSDASLHANRLAWPPRLLEENEVGSDTPKVNVNHYRSPTPVTRRKKPRSTPSASEPGTPRAGTPPRLPLPHLPGADLSRYLSRHRRVVADIEQETNIAATERPYHRWRH
jgi:hypothetical protein